MLSPLLAELRLITVERIDGDSSKVTLLHESGNGKPHTLPFASGRAATFYLRAPVELWTSGKVYELGTPGVAMLLALLAEQPRDGGELWWSTRRFERPIRLSSSTRTRGSKERQRTGAVHAPGSAAQRQENVRTGIDSDRLQLQGEAAPTKTARKKTIAAAKRK